MKSDIIWQTTHRSFIDLFYAEVFVVKVACYIPSSNEINCNCQQRNELVVTKFITGDSYSMHMHCCNVENGISRHFSRHRILSSNFKKSAVFFLFVLVLVLIRFFFLITWFRLVFSYIVNEWWFEVVKYKKGLFIAEFKIQYPCAV